MEDPIQKLKKRIAQRINSKIDKVIFTANDFTYNYERMLFQSTKLFNIKKEELAFSQSTIIVKDRFCKAEIINNYVNVTLNNDIAKDFIKVFFNYLDSSKSNLSSIKYLVSYNKESSLKNSRYLAFSQAQKKILNFFGYSIEELTIVNSFSSFLNIEFEINDELYRYSLNLSGNFDNYLNHFSKKYLNLMFLSKKNDTKLNFQNSINLLNTRNKYYVTAYIIAKINTLKDQPIPKIFCEPPNEFIKYTFFLSDILYNKKKALSITPLIELLVDISCGLFQNNFYCNDINQLSYYKKIINFLTDISQTTFLYY